MSIEFLFFLHFLLPALGRRTAGKKSPDMCSCTWQNKAKSDDGVNIDMPYA